jgi:2,4-dienoyl-CoA reductase-like NADH-dependent reductase (Old Yellow Enzyme family)
MTQNLYSDARIGNLVLENRLAVAPMTRISATEDGLATEQMARYYARFARGGYSLVITEGTYPDLRYSQGYLYQPGIATDAQAEAWRPVVEAVHAEGAKIILQLMHAGALVQGNHWTEDAVAPSAVQPRGEKLSFYRGEGAFGTPREITRKEIDEVVRDFAAASVRARDTGFDGVEIHGANGYLLDQFLTDYTNRRTDEYGGSTENRVRLTVEVVQAVRQAVGSHCTVGVRISQGKINDFHHKWANSEDDARIVFESLAKAKPDFVHVTEQDAAAPAFGEGESLAGLARRYANLPVIANGKLGDVAKAEALVASKSADIVAVGKTALANPDWPKRLRDGEPTREFDFALLQPLAHIKDHER